MAGFFESLFGGEDYKTDFGAIYKDPPKLSLNDYDLWLNQLDSLIGDYEGIRTGTNMFDAIKFLYEPQKAELDRLYGIDTLPGDTYGSKSGTLQQLQSSLNKRGLLDSGTSGLLESQVYADRNRQLADLFGQAKQTQRNEYFSALEKLDPLYSSRYEVRNIPNYLNYFNDTNQYNVSNQRNAATEGDRLVRKAAEQEGYANIFGTIGNAISSAFGMPGAGSSNIYSTLFNNNANSLNKQASQLNAGGNVYVPQDTSMTNKLFGGNNNGGGGLPGNAGVSMPYSTNGYSSGVSFLSPAELSRQNQLNGINQPTTSQQSSLVNNNTPGMSANNGNNFLAKLMQAMGAMPASASWA